MALELAQQFRRFLVLGKFMVYILCTIESFVQISPGPLETYSHFDHVTVPPF